MSGPPPNVVEPRPNVVESLPNVVEPRPNVVESLPNVVEPRPNVVEPSPNVVVSSSSRNSAAEANSYDGGGNSSTSGGNSSASANLLNVVEEYNPETYNVAPTATAISASKAPSTRKIYSMLQTQNLNYVTKSDIIEHLTHFLKTTTKQTLLVCPLFYKISVGVGKGTFYMPESKGNLTVIEMGKKSFNNTTNGTIDSLIRPIITKVLETSTITHLLISLRFNMISNPENNKLMRDISKEIGEPLKKALEDNNITLGLIPEIKSKPRSAAELEVIKGAITADLNEKYKGELLDMTELEIKNVAMVTELLTVMKERIDNGGEPTDFFIDVGPLFLYLRKLPRGKITAKARIHLKSLDAVMNKVASTLKSSVGGARRTRSGRKTRKSRSGRKSRKSHKRR